MSEYRNPTPTVDIIITEESDYPNPELTILLISRMNAPLGWALPGGFVDEGESFEHAAIREAKEEVTLDVWLDELFYVYSDPYRDPRQHNTTTVFIGRRINKGQEPVAADDARILCFFTRRDIEEMILKKEIQFDHSCILMDFFLYHDGIKKNVIFNPMRDVKCVS